MLIREVKCKRAEPGEEGIAVQSCMDVAPSD